MRSINLSAILELIRRSNAISRTEIAQVLNISLPTVMRIIDELIAENLVLPNGETEPSGGRPRSMLRFNGEDSVVLGVDLGGTKMYGAVADLTGNILHEITLVQHNTSGEESYTTLVDLIEQLATLSQVTTRKIRGIGVGAPGVTLHKEGIVTWAPSLNWRDYPLKSRLSQHFGLPVVVDNDVNLAALGELWFGLDDDDVQTMVLITIGTGIGAGIIIDGVLHRGSHEASGEVGYFLLGKHFLGKRYDKLGAFENIASGTGIAERATQALANQLSKDALSKLTAEHVFDAFRRGESWAEPIVDETVDYLAMAIANISTLLDPDIIVLGGGVANSADILLDSILNRIAGTIPVQPKLGVSRLGRKAVALGTITSVLHQTINYYLVRQP